MVYVIKVKHAGSLRRLIFENEPSGNYLSFQDLEGKIREMFQFPASAKLILTYVDDENDEVTMQNDQDLKDACVYQRLNPLRLNVVLTSPPANFTRVPGRIPSLNGAFEGLEEFPWAGILQNFRPEHVKSMCESYEPFFRDVRHPSQIPELVENIMKNVSSKFAFLSNDGRASTSTPATNRTETTPQDRNTPAQDPATNKNGSTPQADATPAQNPVTNENGSTPQSGATNSNVHFNVECDGCNMMPIVGIRYKSTMRDNYDLCSCCYLKAGGKPGEYEVIDRVPFHRPRHCRSYRGRFMGPSMILPSGYMPRYSHWGMRAPQDGQGGRLDARFVRDVSIFDGTELAPGTQFTKIWRLRNSGTAPWPANTQLVNVDGDSLGLSAINHIQIGHQGLAPEEEIEVAVDCIAPPRTGRYHSTWRLAAPWGPKFGHKVWVQIKVVPSDTLKEPAQVDTDGNEVQVAQQGETASTVLPEFPKSATDNAGITLDEKTTFPVPVESVKSDNTDRDDVLVADDGKTGVTIKFVQSDNTDRNEVQRGEISGLSPFDFVKQDNTDKENVQVDQDQDTSFSGPLEFVMSENSYIENAEMGGETSIARPVEFVKSDNTDGDDVPVVQDGETSFVVTSDHTPGDVTMSEQATSGSQTMENMEESFVKVDVNTSGGEAPLIQMIEMLSGSLGDEPMEVTTEVPSSKPAEAKALLSSDEEEATNSKLLAKLESMGFIDRDLNLELLKLNAMDLRKTVDALCYVDDWAPALADLEEMGFNDMQLNRRLMFKNQGSMKRVVKELVQLAKEASGRK